MGFSIHDDLLDNGPAYLKAECTEITVCSAEPTTYTQAHTTYKLADVVVDTADFTLAAGDVNGRKVTQAAQSGITVDADGTANHIAFNDTGATKLLMVKPITAQVVAIGNTITIPANKWETNVPTAV